MGFTPEEVGRMSLWEFMACRDGWNVAHGGDGRKGGGAVADFSDAELREMGIEGF
ncbi:hypothetical protein [Pacificoceanicola onchidii]|uniref:hypothetical protein n=1 Tax=Pacificoceanicola onchidii TaxID=2562685 RepID=UPI001455EA1A|nr:hypothetical protein [Pacificoceanicola onchidii]